jgi:EpsI family protein
MLARSLAVAVLLASSAWIVHGSAPADSGHAAALRSLPTVIGPWSGREEAAFDDDTLRVLGVDEYVNRTYAASAAGGPSVVGLYVGYYATQRQGDAIHSPLNCLPGAGWQPVQRSRVALATGDGSAFQANRLLVQKGRDRQVVLYWYEGRGRRVASEYWNKALLIADAVRLNRTDGALVRLTSPVMASEDETDSRLREFAAALQPALEAALPGGNEEHAR